MQTEQTTLASSATTPSITPYEIAPSVETGSLGLSHLKRIWSVAMAARSNSSIDRYAEDYLDKMVLSCLGLGLHQALQYLYSRVPTFEDFEQWAVATAGEPDPVNIARANATIAGREHTASVREWLESIENSAPVLSAEDLKHWEDNGYIVLREAVPEAACRAAAEVIWDYVGADPQRPDSWYGCVANGIMVELIQHPALQANRCSARIHKAFAQLWGTADLWVSADRCGFHPPQRPGRPFPGPDLHWDVDFAHPLTFGTQGILYLADTPAEQGALTLVPGFHKRLPEWLQTLAPGADPQQQDLHGLGSEAIAGRAGDMVIWHQALPHGSRPNLGTRPRVVQYINMQPGERGPLL